MVAQGPTCHETPTTILVDVEPTSAYQMAASDDANSAHPSSCTEGIIVRLREGCQYVEADVVL
jgi:hypothetical protein